MRMTNEDADRFAVQFLADRDPVLADIVMWRVQEGEITDREAFCLALDFARIEGFDFLACVE
jgi:hypothetical protein